MTAPFTDQPFLELCFAMMLPAVGSAILFNCNASTGGTDIVAMILKKYTSLDIGKALLVSDALIAFSACFVFDIRTGLFSLLGLIIKAFVVDSVIESINLCKYFSIVTSCPDAICDYIIREMNRSSTVIDAIGAYSHEDRKGDPRGLPPQRSGQTAPVHQNRSTESVHVYHEHERNHRQRLSDGMNSEQYKSIYQKKRASGGSSFFEKIFYLSLDLIKKTAIIKYRLNQKAVWKWQETVRRSRRWRTKTAC